MTTKKETTNDETIKQNRLEAARRLGEQRLAERLRVATLMEDDLRESEEIWEEITCPTNPNLPR
jgi:hypothetical protein